MKLLINRRIMIEHYLVAFICFSAYFLVFTVDRKLVDITGGEMDVSGWDFVFTCAFHYLIPVFILYFDKNQMIDSTNKLFKRQFKVVTIFLIIIAIATYGPFERVHWFANLFLILGYYILRIISYILIIILVMKYFKYLISYKRKKK